MKTKTNHAAFDNPLQDGLTKLTKEQKKELKAEIKKENKSFNDLIKRATSKGALLIPILSLVFLSCNRYTTVEKAATRGAKCGQRLR